MSTKKSILFVTEHLNIGGTSTALVSLLRCLDYKKFDADLVLDIGGGPLVSLLPPQVKILKSPERFLPGARRRAAYFLRGYYFRRFLYQKRRGKRYQLGAYQLMSGIFKSRLCRPQKKTYDVAIGFMEGFANQYVAQKVAAAKKIAWIHPDYQTAGFDPALDEAAFARFDRVVLVSEACRKSFCRVFPGLKEKSVVLENMIDESLVLSRAAQPIGDFNTDDGFFHIVTCARLTNCSKRLDRAVSALRRLKDDGFFVKWHVFGDGPDRAALEAQIAAAGLSDDFFLMGGRDNVYPYVQKADLFALCSAYEGKPMAVTEAQILKVPVIVTAYSSAAAQIENGKTGFITENSGEAFYLGIKRLLQNPSLLCQVRQNLNFAHFGAENSIDDFYKLL